MHGNRTGRFLSFLILHAIYSTYVQYYAAGVYATWAYHDAFAAKHAVAHESESFFFLASLQSQQDFSDAHAGKNAGRAGCAARAACHATECIGFDTAELVETGSVNLVQIDGGAWGYLEAEDVHYLIELICECISRTAERASARVSGTVFGPVHAPA